jgi:hypothetical protein
MYNSEDNIVENNISNRRNVMGDLYDKVTEGQDPLTKLISKIPGFNGYIEKNTRRAADKLLREQISSMYTELWKRVGNLQQDLTSAGELQHLDELETAATKLQTFIDKVSNAAYGYAGFFDAIKIKEEELAKIYQFDAALLEMGGEVSRAIDNVETSIGSDGLPAAIRHLVGLSRDLVSTFERRHEVVVAIE